jgi:hypothetical protein
VYPESQVFEAQAKPMLSNSSRCLRDGLHN